MNIYIGYDSRQDYSEDFADVVNPPYQVSKYSIEKYNKSVIIEPIIISELRRKQIYWRGTDYLSSTEFVYSRFLTPYLNGYKGIALFCDSDFLWQSDVNELLDYYDSKYSVMCVKHNYTPPESTKMDGKAQTHTVRGGKVVKYDNAPFKTIDSRTYGLRVGGSVTVKTKLGRNKPTKMY